GAGDREHAAAGLLPVALGAGGAIGRRPRGRRAAWAGVDLGPDFNAKAQRRKKAMRERSSSPSLFAFLRLCAFAPLRQKSARNALWARGSVSPCSRTGGSRRCTRWRPGTESPPPGHTRRTLRLP